MAFQPVPDTLQVQAEFNGTPAGTLDGLKWFFSLYTRDTVGVFDAAAQLLAANYWFAWFNTGKNAGVGLKTLISTSWTFVMLRTRDLGAAGGLSGEFPAAGGGGLRVGDAIPPSAPMIVRLFGDVSGSPKRGRVFWSGGVESDIAGDNYDAAYRAAVAQAFEDYRADLNDPLAGGAANWAQVLVSRNLGTAVDPTPPRIAVRRAIAVTNTLGAAASARSVVGSQRNRREGE